MASKIRLTAETKYQLLLLISQKIRDTLDFDEILNHLLDTIQSVLDYDAAGIFVLNQDLVYSRYGRPKEVIAGVASRGFDPLPPEVDPMRTLGKGIIGHVIKAGESIVAPDVRLDPYYVEGRKATLSEIAVPILRNERTIGALNLESDRLSAFDNDDVDMLRFFADAAAISIEKAMLHRQILEKERLEEQLHVAHEVQSRLLPAESPNVDGYDIAGICIPIYDIGGDYFDYIHLADDRLGVVVADVSGNGIPAALTMTAFRALLRTHARSQLGPSQIMQTINRLLREFTGVADFVTSVYGVLDPKNGEFTYTNSGHNPPILLRVDGSVKKLECGGPLLSVFENMPYDAGKVTLAPGDVLVLYTDGVVEIAGSDGEEFGLERLTTAVRHSRDLPAEAVMHEIIQATSEFSDSASYGDDFTLVIIRRT
jgi:sigma-B regulation protein RsbU (phosphoserine phosphatase)